MICPVCCQSTEDLVVYANEEMCPPCEEQFRHEDASWEEEYRESLASLDPLDLDPDEDHLLEELFGYEF